MSDCLANDLLHSLSFPGGGATKQCSMLYDLVLLHGSVFLERFGLLRLARISLQ